MSLRKRWNRHAYGIGPFLKKRLKQLHVTRKEVARRAGLDIECVKEAVAGVTHPNIVTVAKIGLACGFESLDAFLMGVTVTELLGPDVRAEIVGRTPGE